MIRRFRHTVLYTTLTPCYLCSGAILLFGIPRVVVGEIDSYGGEGSLELLKERGVEVEILGDRRAHALMQAFIKAQPELWAQDVGK